MRRDVRQTVDGSAELQLGEIEEEVPSAGTTRFSSSGAIPDVAPVGTAAPTASERAFGPTTTQLPPDLANKEPGMLWQRQDAGSGIASETKSSANTSKKDRRPEPERRAEQSDNATYHAMNSQLKLLAYELHAAGKKLSFDVALANAATKPDKAQIEQTDARLMVTIHRLDDMARETAKQLSDLRTAKGEPRLVEGGQTLVAALEEFQPVMTYSCKVLAERSPDLAERRDMHDKMSVAAREGCRRKLPDACALVAPDWPAEDRLAALDWNCQVRRSECHRLGAAMLANGRHDDARNEYERACQYGREPALCLELAQLYRDRKLTEPVSGRGATLLRVACASLEADGDTADHPECPSSP